MKLVKIFVSLFFVICPVSVFPQDINTVVFCCSEPASAPTSSAINLGNTSFVSNMGNVVSLLGLVPKSIEIASVEYAVSRGAKEVIVIGHKNCGVVKSVIYNPTGEGHQPAIYQIISKAITEAERAVGSNSELLLERAVEENIRNAVETLRNSRFMLYPLVQSGKLEIIGVIYDPITMKIELLKER